MNTDKINKIPCDCPKGGLYENENGSTSICKKCGGSEWVMTDKTKQDKEELTLTCTNMHCPERTGGKCNADNDCYEWEEFADIKEFPSELAMKITGIILNKEPRWSLELERILKQSLSKAIKEEKQKGREEAVDYIWKRTKEVGVIKGKDIEFYSDQLSAIFENARRVKEE